MDLEVFMAFENIVSRGLQNNGSFRGISESMALPNRPIQKNRFNIYCDRTERQDVNYDMDDLVHVFKSLPDAFFIYNRNNEILFANNACLKLFNAENFNEIVEKQGSTLLQDASQTDFYEIKVINGCVYKIHSFAIKKSKKEYQFFACFLQDITQEYYDSENTKEKLSTLLHIFDKSNEKNILVSTIQTIFNTLEQKDPDTAKHQKRVGRLAVAIAKKMHLSENQILGIYLGSIIHDIGKIYVPAEILSKTGVLKSFELEMIKSHPKVGADIIKNVKFPWPIADIILQHHERLDGSGYPDGLSEADIRLESKIVSVSDVIDATASHRPYRSKLGIKASLENILKGHGKLYDPDVVDVCVDLFQKDGFCLETA